MPPFESDSPPDWEPAIRQVLQGNEAAARRMVEALYPQVLRIVRSHKPRAVEEEDLTQDVFMKVFSKLEGYRAEQPFPHWVARIALNTCYDQLRRQRTRPEFRFADLSEEESRFIQETLSAPAPEANGPGRDGSEVVEKLLGSLNAVEQMALRLLDLERKTVREIIQLTGWSASKIKVAAMRGRRKLAETLKRLEGRRTL